MSDQGARRLQERTDWYATLKSLRTLKTVVVPDERAMRIASAKIRRAARTLVKGSGGTATRATSEWRGRRRASCRWCWRRCQRRRPQKRDAERALASRLRAGPHQSELLHRLGVWHSQHWRWGGLTTFFIPASDVANATLDQASDA